MNKNIQKFFYYYFLWQIILMFKDIPAFELLVRFDFVLVFCSMFYLIKELLNKNLITYSNIPIFVKFLLFLLLLWSCINIFIDPPNNMNGFIRFLGERYYVSSFFPLLFIYIGSKAEYWPYIWHYSIKFNKFIAIFSPLFLVLFFTGSIWWVRVLDLFLLSPILLLNWYMLNRKNKKYLFISYLVILAFCFLGGTRGFVFHLITFVILYLFALLIFPQKNKLVNSLRVSFVVLIIIVLSYFVYSYGLSRYFSGEISDYVYKFENGGFENSREAIVYPEFFLDMRTAEDWIFGRGWNGSYYSPGFIAYMYELNIPRENSLGVKEGYRVGLECGYLQFILKLGLIGLVLFLIISIISIYLGFFRSNNWFSKVSALIVLEWLILMYPAGLPEYHLSYIIVCLCIGALLSKEIRSANSTEEIISNSEKISAINSSYIIINKF